MSAPSSPGWELTLDAVVHYPRPGTDAPAQFAFSPDGRLLTFLWSERRDLVRDLWALDGETGERRVLARAADVAAGRGELPPEEELRRERQRIREGGVTRYVWARNADRLLVPINGQLYVTSSQGEPLRLIAASDEAVVDAQLTPDGKQVVLVRGRELWVAQVDSGAARQLTFDATDTVANGVAEFVAQEEMGRSSGVWLAPDGAALAYTQVDEGPIPPYPIVRQGSDRWHVEHHRYPFAGGHNASVRLGVMPLEGGPTRWLEPGLEEDGYLARVDWAEDGRLLVQAESRDQRRLELRAYEPRGAFQVLLVEESDLWINLHNDLRVLVDGRFLWASERTGFKHLSLHGPEGKLIRALTAGPWPVDAVVHVDEARGQVYLTAGRESPLERHVYSVPLEGGEAVRLTREAGFHSAVFGPAGDRWVHGFESVTQPPRFVLRWVGREDGRVIHEGGELSSVAPGLRPPELVELAAKDGTTLYGAIYHSPATDEGALTRPRPYTSGLDRPLPEGEAESPSPLSPWERVGVRASPLSPWERVGVRAGRPPPLIVSLYGGPHAQMVTNSWGMTVDLRAQYLASLGFVVFKLDNRGSARRGLAFEGAIRWRLGSVDMEDQVTGAQWLVERGLVDPERVGVYGWSYGGYLAAMLLFTAPAAFRVAVAGAPVVDWDGYDTHYTERYMGKPSENPEGYRAASLLTHAEKLQGRLLLVHGMMDENVHFRHTARLVEALVQAERPFDLLVLPEERHGLRQSPRAQSARRHLEARVAQHFVENL